MTFNRIWTASTGQEMGVSFTLQSHFVDFSHDHWPVCSLQCTTTECEIWGFTALCK